MKPDTVHIAMTDSGTVACITTDPAVAKGLEEQDLSVEMDAPALVALQRLQGEAPWRRLADNEAWQRIANAMELFAKTIGVYGDPHENPVFPTTPPDLPPLLIEGRSSVIEAYPRSIDIPTLRELTELQMAWIEKREVDLSHFRPESLKTSWGKMKHEPLAVMYEQLGRLSSNIQHDVGEDARHHEATRQIIREIQMVIDLRLESPDGQKELAELQARERGEPAQALVDAFHAIYSESGDLLKVTMDDTESSMAQAEGLTVVANTTSDELLDYLIGRKRLLEVMDDQTWAQLGKALLVTVATDDTDFAFSINSADLPLSLAEQRLDIVERFFEPKSVKSWVELSEIVMAREQQRPVNHALLSQESLADRFVDRYKNTLLSLERTLDWATEHAGEIQQENASERAAFGDSGPGSAKAEAVAIYVATEAAFLVDHWSAMQEELSDDEGSSMTFNG